MSSVKVLLIWPPMLTSNILPLSIPFLTAFLKKNGIRDSEVLDMNIAYWKTLKPYWFLYALVQKANKILTRKKNYAFSSLQKLMSDAMVVALEKMQVAIPWSLKSILAALEDDARLPERKKIKTILGQVLCRTDLTFVAISVNYPAQLFFSLLIAREIKGHWGDKVRIVMGGAQITKHIDYLTKDPRVREVVDFFVEKDGEEPLLKLLTHSPGGNFSDIPNLYFKNAANEFERSGLVYCLYPDDYPIPDFSGFDLELYDERFPLIVSKGCPWGQCAFCSFSGVHDHKFYGACVEKAVGIIREMQERYGASEFVFMDDALQPAFMRLLAEEIIRRDLSIIWTTSIILSQSFLDVDFCRLLKRSGLNCISFGLESVSPRLLKLMNKYHQALGPDEIKSILGVLKSQGIGILVCVIFGFPTETREEALLTFRFIAENIDLFSGLKVQSFCLEDFTQVFQEPLKFGIKKIYKDDKNIGLRLGYRFETEIGMKQEEVVRFTNEAAAILRQAFINKKNSKKSLAHNN